MYGLGIITGAGLMGIAWAVLGWRKEKPDRHAQYIREWRRALRAWWWPPRARHRRRTLPLLIRTKTVRQAEAPMPLEW